MMFSFFLILAVIGIIVGAIWTWKNKNWSKLKKAAITIILAASLLIAVYASIALILISADQATYFTQGSNLGEIDFDRIISNAKNAGYEVDGPYYGNTKQKIGVHPSNIKELDERFGEDYRFLSVGYFYSGKVYFSTYDSDGGTAISFSNEERPDILAQFKPEDLPPDEWIVEKFRLMFDLTELESREYLTQLKESIRNSQGTSGTITIKKALNIPALYSDLKATSTSSNVSITSGEGGFIETFYSMDKKIGYLDLSVPNERIIFQDKGREYIIKIDRLGGIAPEIKLATREEIPEEEYHSIFKEMFINLGLPPEKVDEFEFNYVPGVLSAESNNIRPTNISKEINSNNFLFFEISHIDNITSECLPRPYYDFPTYYFNKTDRHLYPNIVPEGSYDFIEFNRSLIAIVGVGNYGNGASSQLEPIYELPYSSIGKASKVPNYWTQTEEMSKINITNITERGLLVVYFENQSIELAPGSNWSKLEQCSELRIENFEYLDKNTNDITLKSRKHLDYEK